MWWWLVLCESIVVERSAMCALVAFVVALASAVEEEDAGAAVENV